MNAKELKAAFQKAGPAFAIVDIDGIGKVRVVEISLRDVDNVTSASEADSRAKNMALSIYTEDGKERVFDPDNDNDVEIIKSLGMRNINKMITALQAKN